MFLCRAPASVKGRKMSPVCLQSARMVDSHIPQIRPNALPMPMLPAVLPFGGKPRRGDLAIRCSVCSPLPATLTDGGAGGESVEVLERLFRGPTSSGSADMGPVMKGQHGAFGAVTLEKGKLDMSQKQSKSSPEVNVYNFIFFSNSSGRLFLSCKELNWIYKKRSCSALSRQRRMTWQLSFIQRFDLKRVCW